MGSPTLTFTISYGIKESVMTATTREVTSNSPYGSVFISITVDGGTDEVNENIARAAVIGAYGTLGNINSRLMMFAEPGDQRFDSSISNTIKANGIALTITAEYSSQSSAMLVLAGCLEQVGSACSSAISSVVPFDQERIARVVTMSQGMMQPMQPQFAVQPQVPQQATQPLRVQTNSTSDEPSTGQYL